MSREHCVSEIALREISGDPGGGTIEVCGLPWLNGGTRTLPTASLTARVLCKRHNEALSGLDARAAECVRGLDAIHDGFGDGQAATQVVDGDLLERWMLKTLCGSLASENMVNQVGDRVPGWQPSREWLDILYGQAPFRRGCGLYLARTNTEPTPFSRQLLRLCPLWGPDRQTSIGLRMWLFNLEYVLAMDDVVRHMSERLLDHAVYRPSCIQYQVGPLAEPVKRLWFRWKTPGGHEPFEVIILPSEAS
jgi:hypothetical protein